MVNKTEQNQFAGVHSDATPGRIWVSVFFLACKMPFKQARERGKRNHGAKVAFLSFWCVANCIVSTPETVFRKSDNFILLSFTFDSTPSVPIALLHPVHLLEWRKINHDFFFLGKSNYFKYFIKRYPVTTHTWWVALRDNLKNSVTSQHSKTSCLSDQFEFCY